MYINESLTRCYDGYTQNPTRQLGACTQTNNKNAKIRIYMTQASAAPVFTHITPENTKQCVFEVYYYCYESVSVLLSTV